jgi:glycerophosphoryl diester phosphodiesterase
MKFMRIFSFLLLAIAPVLINVQTAHAASCPTGIIHRGNVQKGAAENTPRAFNDAFNLGLQWVESDTYFTSDGYPVLFHNTTVDGATNGTGTIASMTLAQFKALTYKNGQPTASLQDALLLFPGTSRHLLLEVKLALTVSQQQTLVAMLRGFEPQVHLTGFAPTLSSLLAIKKINPAIDISYLAHDAKNNLQPGMSGKNVKYSELNYFNVSTLKKSGYIVRAWTPNSVGDWRLLKLAGVNAIITDKAAEYSSWVNSGCN